MKIKFIYIPAALLFGVVACKQHQVVDVTPAAPLISDSLAKIITLDTARAENIENDLALSGDVETNDDQTVKIFPNASGQVKSVNVTLGDKVSAGQTLAVIQSADVAGNYADLSSANADAAIAEKEYRNAEQLYRNGISSQKEFEQSKLEYQKAMTVVSKVRSQITINGGGKTSSAGIYRIVAPRAGYVVEKNINAGSFIRNDNGQNIFTISGIQNVWVTANVFETDLDKVKPGKPAVVTTLAFPDKEFYGNIDHISSVLDAQSKAVKVRIDIANPDLLLKPGMFTKIFIADKEADSAVEIPARAIVFDNGKNFVITYQDRNHLGVREVDVLKTAGTKAYLRSGLSPGEVLVSSEELLLYNEISGE